MSLENITWKGEFNLYTRVLDKLNLNSQVTDDLFSKIEGIYIDLSKSYLENRQELIEEQEEFNSDLLDMLNKEVGNLHDSFKEKTPAVTWIETPYFAFKDDECLKITELVEERLTQEDLATLSNIAFDNWRYHCKLGDPKKASFDSEGKRIEGVCIPHINHANDFFGKEIYERFRAKIGAGEEIRVMDLGAGTGGTTEAIVNWVYTLAEEEHIDASKIKLNVVGVEFNHNLASDFQVKASELYKKYKGVNISVMEEDMAQYVSQITQGNEQFDAIAASYSLHHLEIGVRQKLMLDAYGALADGGVFLRADPNGGMSDINRRYFNFTDEGTFASFDIGETSAEDLTGAGFSGIDVLGDASYKNRLNDLLKDTKIVDSLIEDYKQDKGYISIGIKE